MSKHNPTTSSMASQKSKLIKECGMFTHLNALGRPSRSHRSHRHVVFCFQFHLEFWEPEYWFRIVLVSVAGSEGGLALSGILSGRTACVRFRSHSLCCHGVKRGDLILTCAWFKRKWFYKNDLKCQYFRSPTVFDFCLTCLLTVFACLLACVCLPLSVRSSSTFPLYSSIPVSMGLHILSVSVSAWLPLFSFMCLCLFVYLPVSKCFSFLIKGKHHAWFWKTCYL